MALACETEHCQLFLLQNVGNPRYSTCGQQGVAVKPRQGDALLFYSQTPNGTLDTLSLHSGCPVIHGNKWSATKCAVATWQQSGIPAWLQTLLSSL